MAQQLSDETLELRRPVALRLRHGTRRAERVARLVDVAAPQVPGWEWGIAVGALFALGRSPLRFYRLRLAEATGGTVAFVWQDDAIIRATTAAILLVVFVLAARRCDPRALLRHPVLMFFVTVVLVSTAWSVEPAVSLWRSGFFIGTGVLGWYIAERYPLREQISLVGGAAALSAVASAVALVVWPAASRRTGALANAWSGAYGNRNWFGLMLSLGLLTIPFLWTTVAKRRRVLLLFVAMCEALLLLRTGSRTGPVALAAAGAVAAAILVVRKLDLRPLGTWAGVASVSLFTGYLALVVHWNWLALLHWMGRRPNITGRTKLWRIDLALAFRRPWFGWGFESVWSHPATAARVTEEYGRFPAAAHSGYYEMLLSVGIAGLALFLLFLGIAGWRSFRFAWLRRDAVSMWPVVFLVFAIVANFSESLFVSADSIWALTVAAAMAVTPTIRRRRSLSASTA